MKFLQKLLAIALAAPTVLGATLQKVTDYGLNPGNVDMYYYIPDCIASNPTGRPLLIALHYCTGTAQAMYSGAHAGPSFKSLADKYGFVIVFPEVKNDPGQCWDVSHSASLTRWGGGESHSIINQLTYAINTWTLDATKVFAIGISSGASMVNTLAALYPDKLTGGAVYSGVAHQCFVSTSLWSYQCSSGARIKTPTEWGDLVRSGYPTYTGLYPKMQLWHNDPDEFFNFQNLIEEVKQWSNVHGYTTTPVLTTSASPNSDWTRKDYGARLQTVTSTTFGGHVFRIESEDTINYFGLNKNIPSACPGSTSTATSTASTPLPTTVVEKWSQCGGDSWAGPTVCAVGSTCTYVNAYYWQCL